MTVLAHAGHWLTSLLYVVPIVVVVGALGLQVLREKRLAAREDGAVPGEDPPVTP